MSKLNGAGRLMIVAGAIGSLWLGSSAGEAQPAPPSPLLGQWQIDMVRTKLNMNGPDKPFAPRDPSFTWIFATEADHMRMRVYAKYPQPTPSRTVVIYGDGAARPCETKVSCWNSAAPETGARESVAYWRITPYMYVRITRQDDRVMEGVTLNVSTDGKSLTAISWHPETPYYQNIQIFNRVG